MNKKLDVGLETTKKIWNKKRVDLLDEYGELGEYIINHAFGDIYSRDSLSLRERELVTIATLIAQGSCELQLENHMKGALNLGITIDELFEVVLQSYLYNGFPKAIQSYKVLKKIADSIENS